MPIKMETISDNDNYRLVISDKKKEEAIYSGIPRINLFKVDNCHCL